jgi:transglutaminase-like putative cysteine protease
VLVPGRRGSRGPFEAIAFDPTHDRRVEGAGYVTVAVGRDYADVAPTSGSFSGRCSGVLAASKVLKPVTA